MTTALLIALLILAIVFGWYLFEAYWDQKIFAPKPGQVAENIGPREASTLLAQNPEVQVLDVRSAREFSGGSLPRAVNISLGDPAFADRMSELDPQRPVLVYCAGGYRSRKAVAVLRGRGFENIHHLHRGFMSWKGANLPVSATSAK